MRGERKGFVRDKGLAHVCVTFSRFRPFFSFSASYTKRHIHLFFSKKNGHTKVRVGKLEDSTGFGSLGRALRCAVHLSVLSFTHSLCVCFCACCYHSPCVHPFIYSTNISVSALCIPTTPLAARVRGDTYCDVPTPAMRSSGGPCCCDRSFLYQSRSSFRASGFVSPAMPSLASARTASVFCSSI